MEPTKITTVQQLIELATEEEGVDCFIALAGGMRSSKHIRYWWDEKRFYILNEIDGSEQELTEAELYCESNIGAAIDAGNFYQHATVSL